MTRFEQEIEEMPNALRRLVSYYRGPGAERLAELRQRCGPDRDLYFSGMGTSLFCPEVVFPRLARSGRLVRAVDTGEWLHKAPSVPGKSSLVVLTSQSGESGELRRLLEQQPALASTYVAVTNSETSTLARSAALVLPLMAGDEASVSTKTYANTLALYTLLASALEGASAQAQALDVLDACADALERPVAGIAETAAVFERATGLCFVGRGPAHVAARQCALTFMEGTRILSSSFTGGAFNHGPFECVAPGFTLVVLDGGGNTRSLAEGLADRGVRLGATVVLAAPDAKIGHGYHPLVVPRYDSPWGEELFPLLFSSVQNRLIHAIAAAHGHEAGVFRHGGKVTSHE